MMCNLRLYQLVELKILHIKPLSWLLGFIWSNKGCPYYWREVWQKLGNNGINRELGRKETCSREQGNMQPPSLPGMPSVIGHRAFFVFVPLSILYLLSVCLFVCLSVCLSLTICLYPSLQIFRYHLTLKLSCETAITFPCTLYRTE